MPETTDWNDPRISRILELELEITTAVINGHQPTADDEFKEKRLELERLRLELIWQKKPRNQT